MEIITGFSDTVIIVLLTILILILVIFNVIQQREINILSNSGEKSTLVQNTINRLLNSNRSLVNMFEFKKLQYQELVTLYKKKYGEDEDFKKLIIYHMEEEPSYSIIDCGPDSENTNS